MATSNINRVTLTGNLTRDPELRTTPNGFNICELRVAVNGRRKDNATGEWIDKPNYFDVKVLGRNGENAAKFLSRGRPVAIDGRLDWSEWQDKETGKNRQKVEVVADNIQFLGSRDGGEGGNGGGYDGGGSRYTPQGDAPADTSDFAQPAPVGGGSSAPPPAEDDIPF